MMLPLIALAVQAGAFGAAPRSPQNFAAPALAAVGSASEKEPAALTNDGLNPLFGINIWSGSNLWDEDASAVAKRLRWPQESKTSYDSSYRLYPPAGARVLDARPYSLALYGDASGKVAQISMVFANAGDIQDLVRASGGTVQKGAAANGTVALDARTEAAITKQLRDTIAQETKAMKAALTARLGVPSREAYGPTGATEPVMRWDWNGHAILITSNDQYLSVRIVPSKKGTGARIAHISDAKLRNTMAGRVERRDNGDIVITDIPMVNQGPKGYCVPATWERDLRYTGIDADMYVLAAGAGSRLGGGTSLDKMAGAVAPLIRLYERNISTWEGRISLANLSDKLDQGTPIMWAMIVNDNLNEELAERMAERAQTTDWGAYAKGLAGYRSRARFLPKNLKNAHMCMIIGYNSKTGELAISDSWGPSYAERWITVEEAEAISQGSFATIGW